MFIAFIRSKSRYIILEENIRFICAIQSHSPGNCGWNFAEIIQVTRMVHVIIAIVVSQVVIV